ncbi:S-adenosyl-L-methionine-dependent methyltransferase [Triangularia verruculosa]|uniref:S-adenosyl-L-methionine-dependent methyltransferase n=1 Tax=Triangularia verruculosa TaxID=2587418 RepID=A0AAN6XCC3_9PEZI|nr:S-adenosyl-L-methionine-dependent methyltransferase [Triangularia verruculosa]
MADLSPKEIKARLERSYDAIADTYNAWTVNHPSSLRLSYLDRLLHLLQTQDSPDESHTGCDKSALELGCGNGQPILQRLFSSGLFSSIVANDMSSVQLNSARSELEAKHDNVQSEWIHGDMTSLSFDPCSFNIIIGLYTLIHLPRSEQLLMLEKISRWLKPGGLALLNFSKEDTEADVIEQWLGRKEGWMFWSGHGASSMPGLIQKVQGLEIVVGEIRPEDEGSADVEFYWVILRKIAIS